MNQGRKPLAARAFGGAIIFVTALGSGCTDPVRDEQIDQLGPEAAGVPIGPDHRPGQPCVLCHSDGGPASGKPFAVAGTIYETNKPGSGGAAKISIQFIDARGNGPLQIVETSTSGNFYVPLQNWPTDGQPLAGPAFPIRVGLYKDVDGEPVQVMKSLINREPSCNFCHRPNLKNPTEDEIDASRSSAGQVYLETAQ